MSLITWIKNLFATKEEAPIPVTSEPVTAEPPKKKRVGKPRNQSVKKPAVTAPKASKPVDSMESVKLNHCRTLSLCERQAIGKTVETLGYDVDTIKKLHNICRAQAMRILCHLKYDKEWANTYELHQFYDREDCMMVYYLLQFTHDPREVGSLFGITGTQVNAMVKELGEDDKKAALKWVAIPSFPNRGDFSYWCRHISDLDKSRLLRFYRKLIGGLVCVTYIPQFKTSNYGNDAARCRKLLAILGEGGINE